MLEQALIPLADKSRWEEVLRGMSHGPAHCWAYNEALAKTHQQEVFLYASSNLNLDQERENLSSDPFKAICPVVLRKKFNTRDVVTPYGFGGLVTQGHYPDFPKQWQTFYKQQNLICGYFALHPLFNHPQITNHAITQSASPIYIIDLTLSVETLMSNMTKAHRYELRQWENSSVQIIDDKTIITEYLTPLYFETLNRVKANQVYHFNKETLHQLIHDEKTLALAAVIDKKIEAIILFIHTAYIADYFLNASTDTGRIHTRGLLWHGMQRLKEMGVPTLNLGGGIKPNDSLDDFKRRFGGTLVNTKVLKQIFDESIFEELCTKTNTSLASTHYFPPYYTNTKI